VDRPILSYIVEEAAQRASSISCSSSAAARRPSRTTSTPSPEIEQALAAKGKLDILEDLRRDLASRADELRAPDGAAGPGPRGLVRAPHRRRRAVRGDAARHADDAEPPALAQAVAAYEQVGGNIVVVEPAPEGEAHKYGIVAWTAMTGGSTA
jgi:UTP--glucose-1-phosphate uridylyltransferase